MKSTRSDLIRTLKGLSDNQLNFKSAPDRWSVKECMYHIAIAEKTAWGALEKALSSPANPEKRAEIKFTDDALVALIKNRTNKATAPDIIQPKNSSYKSMREALEDFKDNRAEHIKYMKATTEDLRNRVVQMPFGWIDCYQLTLFMAAHSERHRMQMEEVKADPNFPKK
jgi:hypothetical protein